MRTWQKVRQCRGFRGERAESKKSLGCKEQEACEQDFHAIVNNCEQEFPAGLQFLYSAQPSHHIFTTTLDRRYHNSLFKENAYSCQPSLASPLLDQYERWFRNFVDFFLLHRFIHSFTIGPNSNF